MSFVSRHLESSVIITTFTRRNTPRTYLHSVYCYNACPVATQWNRSVKNQPQVREWVNATRITICHEIVAISTVSLRFSNQLRKSFPSFISDQLKRTLSLCRQNSLSDRLRCSFFSLFYKFVLSFIYEKMFDQSLHCSLINHGFARLRALEKISLRNHGA